MRCVLGGHRLFPENLLDDVADRRISRGAGSPTPESRRFSVNERKSITKSRRPPDSQSAHIRANRRSPLTTIPRRGKFKHFERAGAISYTDLQTPLRRSSTRTTPPFRTRPSRTPGRCARSFSQRLRDRPLLRVKSPYREISVISEPSRPESRVSAVRTTPPSEPRFTRPRPGRI